MGFLGFRNWNTCSFEPRRVANDARGYCQSERFRQNFPINLWWPTLASVGRNRMTIDDQDGRHVSERLAPSYRCSNLSHCPTPYLWSSKFLFYYLVTLLLDSWWRDLETRTLSTFLQTLPSYIRTTTSQKYLSALETICISPVWS